ncbi:MAG TPA: hypothetical protein VGP76_04645 [Planctomycetaceae bacterium]|jgi:hypothetical protein|nr:hypothetical protein [Planctomycetaceae bacterium]
MATATANPQGNNDPFDARTGINLLGLLANGHATTVTPFLRRGFGSEALGANGIVAALIILIYAGMTNSPEMITFFWVWLMAVACQRIYGFRQRANGEVVHSRYAGWPEVGMRFAKTEKVARSAIEPLVCVVVGGCLWSWSEALGRFILLGSFSLLVSRGLEQQVTRNRLRAMNDAQIEQRYLSDVFNHRREEV